MDKQKARVWALNTGGNVYALKVCEKEPSIMRTRNGTWWFCGRDNVGICIDMFEYFTSIRLKPGKVGCVDLESLKQLRLVESKRGEKKSQDKAFHRNFRELAAAFSSHHWGTPIVLPILSPPSSFIKKCQAEVKNKR